MTWPVDAVLLVALILAAFAALHIRNLVNSVMILVAYSVLTALLFAGLGAVDVAFVEFVLGAGVIGILFFALLYHAGTRERLTQRRDHRWLALPFIALFLGLMLYASSGLPDRGDPAGPASTYVSPDYIENSLEDTNTPNVVTAVLADYRSLDTLGEVVVIVTAGLACVLILLRRREE
jgi:multicomponent Na+:H+ antiporter subunit B